MTNMSAGILESVKQLKSLSVTLLARKNSADSCCRDLGQNSLLNVPYSVLAHMQTLYASIIDCRQMDMRSMVMC